ncbi:Proline 2-methylase for pyrrolysine biosynthesis [Methanosarcina siciliae T4/M]|uniref:Proline 2-methylase for pyrrolysine biosynthesis n=2 Tax=Methanosarcina siciliae TaxID=38027 RepID=A0A0E3P9V5_9EURY|nr:methylornithine synthase PylB [Methanosarcina siciliae]AKB26846.1 Proline 2-methylase for pyrrolysine biosynthesis [Methanosarcina siciliae T4/M]AKB30813.1 Proline 2-methylase for pyrrolysine biosynthesis [Methanosarcina siciliae HI350]
MIKKMATEDLDRFGEKIIEGFQLSDEDLRGLLSLESEEELEKLYYVARKVRNQYFGNRVFLNCFIYFSTYCRNQCSFCYYNCKNEINRYRLTQEEIKETCKTLKGAGFHMIDLTMGEDPYYYEEPDRFVELVQMVKDELGLPIMISPGVMDNATLLKAREKGANFFALYQETYDQELYEKLRLGQSFEGRYNARRFAKEQGYCIEDGILTGVGNDIESTIKSLRGMKSNDPDMVRVMTFLPQEGTPLEGFKENSNLSELKIIAILRLMFPKCLIPASLDLEGIDGMVHRLNAGANIVTSILPSDSKLEGVANYDRGLEERDRDIKSVIKRLEGMGMEPAPQAEFETVLGC